MGEYFLKSRRKFFRDRKRVSAGRERGADVGTGALRAAPGEVQHRTARSQRCLRERAPRTAVPGRAGLGPQRGSLREGHFCNAGIASGPFPAPGRAGSGSRRREREGNEGAGGGRAAPQPPAPLGAALGRAGEVGAAARLCGSGRVCIGLGRGEAARSTPHPRPLLSPVGGGPGGERGPDIWGRGRARPPRVAVGARLPARHWRRGAGEGGGCSPRPRGRAGWGPACWRWLLVHWRMRGGRGAGSGGAGGARAAGGGVSANRVGGFSTEGERKVCGAGGEGAAKRAGPGAGPAAAALGRGAAAGGPPLDFCRGGGIAPSFSSPQG